MLAVLVFPQSELKHSVFLYYHLLFKWLTVIFVILSPSIQMSYLFPIKLPSLFLYKNLFGICTPF
jgi:hypothetical protein